VAAAPDLRLTAGEVVHVAAGGRWHDSGRWPATRAAQVAAQLTGHLGSRLDHGQTRTNVTTFPPRGTWRSPAQPSLAGKEWCSCATSQRPCSFRSPSVSRKRVPGCAVSSSRVPHRSKA
jgi:hypothetical protein